MTATVSVVTVEAAGIYRRTQAERDDARLSWIRSDQASSPRLDRSPDAEAGLPQRRGGKDRDPLHGGGLVGPVPGAGRDRGGDEHEGGLEVAADALPDLARLDEDVAAADLELDDRVGDGVLLREPRDAGEQAGEVTEQDVLVARAAGQALTRWPSSIIGCGARCWARPFASTRCCGALAGCDERSACNKKRLTVSRQSCADQLRPGASKLASPTSAGSGSRARTSFSRPSSTFLMKTCPPGRRA